MGLQKDLHVDRFSIAKKYSRKMFRDIHTYICILIYCLKSLVYFNFSPFLMPLSLNFGQAFCLLFLLHSRKCNIINTIDDHIRALKVEISDILSDLNCKQYSSYYV